MNDYKSILQSRTVIGIVIGLIALAYPTINQILTVDDVLSTVTACIGLASLIGAIVARVRATKVIASSSSSAIDKLNAASGKRVNHDE